MLEILKVLNEINLIEKVDSEIERLANEIARYGGSNKNPDGTMARRLPSFGIVGATFNRNSKESISNPLSYLENIVNSELYNEMLEYNNDGIFDKEKFREDFKEKYTDEQFDTINEFSTFPKISSSPKIFDLKEYVEVFSDLRSDIIRIKEYVDKNNEN